MSLVGSLEDLGLGEILQIISLSRKSGRLRLRSAQGKGWILFRDGEIRAAELAGGPTDLRELLVARGALEPGQAERLTRAARESGASFAEVAAREGGASAERIAVLRLEHVEATVLGMFDWAAGEFSFEIGSLEGAVDADLTLTSGLNPQFLALEGARLQDERARAGSDPAAPDEEAWQDDANEKEVGTLGPADGSRTAVAGAPEATAAPAPPRPRRGRFDAAPPARRGHASDEPAPVVVIEPELPELERIKCGLAEDFRRIHVFQRSDLAIARIRQYLARGETPLVVLSARTPPDPLSGARGWREILERLKGQAPRMPVFLLEKRGSGPDPLPLLLDGVLEQAEPGRERELGAALRGYATPGPQGAKGGPAPPTPPGRAAGAVPPPLSARIAAAAARLRDPAFRGEVLPLVLRLAGEMFSRVAIFMVRDGAALGLAQLGLPSAGGPDDSGIRRVALRVDEPAWFRRVLETRAPGCAPPSDPGDLRLATLLGSAPPAQAFVAPLATGNTVVALIYADTLPGAGPLPESAALEALLRAAGLALERALGERARL